VNADGSGQATMAMRLYVSNMRAFDSLFSGEAPQRPPQIEEELPPPSEGALRAMFGTSVRLVSTRLDRAPEGGFDDIRKVQLWFPPIAGAAGAPFDSIGSLDPALITFAIRKHDNGDRLLIVKLP